MIPQMKFQPVIRGGIILLSSLFLLSCATVPQGGSSEQSSPGAEDGFEDDIEVYDRMSAAILLGDPREAIQAYEQAKLDDPDDPASRILLARLQIAAGELDTAETMLRELLNGSGDNDSGEGASAENSSTRELSDGDRADALVSLSLIERARGRREAEEDLLVQALQADESNVQANTGIGEILLEKEQYNRAEQRFQKALETEDDNFVALQGLGNSYLRNGKSQDAISAFSRAIEVDPDYSYSYVDRSRAFVEQGYYDRAIADMTRAIDLDNQNGWNYLDRGRMNARSGNFEAAEQDFSRAIQRIPGVFLNYAYRGQVRAFLGEYEDAAADYEQALEIRPDYYPAYSYLGALEYIRGNHQNSGRLLDEAWKEEKARGSLILFSAAAGFAQSPGAGRSYLEDRLGEFSRDDLFYFVGRFFIDGVDTRLLRQIQQEEDMQTKALAQFFTALRYAQRGQISTALALLNSQEQERLEGTPEGVVRTWLIDELSQ